MSRCCWSGELSILLVFSLLTYDLLFFILLRISPVTMSMHKIRHVSGMRPLYVRLSQTLSRYITLDGDRNGIMNCPEDRELKARYVSMFRW